MCVSVPVCVCVFLPYLICLSVLYNTVSKYEGKNVALLIHPQSGM